MDQDLLANSLNQYASRTTPGFAAMRSEGDGRTVSMSYDHLGRRRTKGGQRFFYDGYLQVANGAQDRPCLLRAVRGGVRAAFWYNT